MTHRRSAMEEHLAETGHTMSQKYMLKVGFNVNHLTFKVRLQS